MKRTATKKKDTVRSLMAEWRQLQDLTAEDELIKRIVLAGGAKQAIKLLRAKQADDAYAVVVNCLLEAKRLDDARLVAECIPASDEEQILTVWTGIVSASHEPADIGLLRVLSQQAATPAGMRACVEARLLICAATKDRRDLEAIRAFARQVPLQNGERAIALIQVARATERMADISDSIRLLPIQPGLNRTVYVGLLKRLLARQPTVKRKLILKQLERVNPEMADLMKQEADSP